MFERLIDKDIFDSLVLKLGTEPRNSRFTKAGRLVALDISFLDLTELPIELWHLTNLTKLTCVGNELRHLPSEIGLLTRLQDLDVRGNGLRMLPREIGRLTRLRRLSVGHVPRTTAGKYGADHQLMNIDEELKNHSNVFRRNYLSELPVEIRYLQKLELLECTLNQLTEIPLEIGFLTKLRKLFLGWNYLQKLPMEIGRITELRELYLHNNPLTELPIDLSHLTNLKTLTLGSDYLKQIPFELGKLSKMERLDLLYCPSLLTPPPEIIDQGTPQVMNFLRELERDSTIRYEAKLLVVGEGGTGKSSLLRALRAENAATLSSTHGIEVGTCKLQHPTKSNIETTLNTWDFGGQEIYHATHQFFLTRRSLYLVVWNARLGADQGRLHYWLDTIKALAPDAPVLLIATHIDERDPDLNLPLYEQAFPQVVGSLSVSNVTGEGIDQLRRVMSKFASGLPLMGQPWPSSWIAVEKDLLDMPDHHITSSQYMECCREHHVQAEMAQGTLGSYLHDLGKILYFRDDYLLSNLIVLKPNWVTKAISQVLTDETTRDAKGILTHADLPRIWAIDEDGRPYEPHLYPVFLRLMERFDLSYQIEAGAPNDHTTHSLVPQLLPHQPPPDLAPWPQRPPEGTAQLEMIYKLDFVPAGIMSWFIVRSHPYTKEIHWREGVLLEYEGHGARVELNPMLREIRLAVWGLQPHNFFTILKNTLDLILDRFEGLRISREVPCICHRGRKAANCLRFYLYEDLVRRMDKTKYWIECPDSFKRVSVTTLLYGIHPSTDEQVMADIRNGQQTIIRELGSLKKVDLILDKLNQQSELIVRNFTRQWNLEMQKLEAECPSTFWLATPGRDVFNPKDWVSQEYKMYLLCQHPPAPHSVGDGYRLREAQVWWKEVSPWLNHLIRFLKYGVPLGKAIGAVYDEASVKERETQIGLMEEITKALPEPTQLDLIREPLQEQNFADDQIAIGPALRALYKFLDSADPGHIWGGLARAITPDGNILWLCEAHRKRYEAKPLVLST